MSILIDALILALLIATIGYAFLVERRVRTLMQALGDLHPAVMAFSDAVDRSEGSVEELRALSAPWKGRENQHSRRASIPGRAESEPEQSPPARELFRVPEKADLIRSFFESAREKQA